MKLSWGLYPYFPQTPHSPHWRSELPHLLSQLGSGTLPYGNGRSYGDSCLAVNDQVVHMRSLDRFIAVDWEKGIVTVEAGMTLEELLTAAIPKGWFLPVVPGTKFVTLGGAVANDIHGKNHHCRGTFGRHVRRFSLVRSDLPPSICKAGDELFAATIGGLGLTGIIEWVELQLIPIQSSFIDASYTRFDSLDEFFTLSSSLDHQHEYTVAWIDCLAKGGRGVYIVGDHSPHGELALADVRKTSVPITPPLSMINGLTLRLFNSAYYHFHATKNDHISYEPFFFPLDRILSWNRIYGRKGFQQYQCVVPEQEAVRELLQVISASNTGSFLAILKRCGDLASPGLLSFPTPGISLALDFPQKDANFNLFAKLDTIVRLAKGRQYPAKDAHMTADDFRTSYPAWKQIEALRDPMLCSRFWKRVTHD